jgi:hypothetical protein
MTLRATFGSVDGNAWLLRIATSAVWCCGQRAANETNTAFDNATTIRPGQRASSSGKAIGLLRRMISAPIAVSCSAGMAPLDVAIAPSRNELPMPAKMRFQNATASCTSATRISFSRASTVTDGTVVQGVPQAPEEPARAAAGEEAHNETIKIAAAPMPREALVISAMRFAGDLVTFLACNACHVRAANTLPLSSCGKRAGEALQTIDSPSPLIRPGLGFPHAVKLAQTA